MAFEFNAGEPALVAEFRLAAAPIFAAEPDAKLVQEAQQSDVCVCRFLRARGADVKEAVKMFKASVAWRKEVKADTIGERPCDFLPKLKACYPYAFHKFDKAGRPIYIDQTGYMNIKEIMKLTTMENMLELHIKQCEFVNGHLYKIASERAGGQIYQVTSIVDLKRLSSKNLTKKAYAWLKASSKIDQDNYPESLGKLFVVNVPVIFGAVWAIVSPWLDKRTKQKIQVLKGKNFSAELLKHIDAASLPVQYGGTCACEGGCLSHNSELEEEFLSYAMCLPKADLPAAMSSCPRPNSQPQAEEEEDAAGGDDEKDDDSAASEADTPKSGKSEE